MAWEQIASGTGSDLDQISSYEGQIPEENRAKLDLQTLTHVPTFQMDALRNSLEIAGVTEVQVTGSGNTLSITYRKGAFWIPLIIALVLALAIVIVLWIFYKEVVGDIGPVPATLMVVGLGILALVVSYNLVRRH